MTAAITLPRPRRVMSLLAAVVGVMALTLASGGSAPSRAADVIIIDVESFAFQPTTITIRVGDTIQWNNADPVDHTATSSSGPASFDVYVSAGAWGSHTFDVAGTYEYYCIPHPTMTGRIVVEPAASAPGSPGGGPVPDVAMPAPAEPTSTPLIVLALAGLLALGWTDVRRRRRSTDPERRR